jgi:conjugative relaxase-like TrwC/TraI family protein
MLSIKPIGSSAGEVSYYAELGQEDYYVVGGEPPGVWWGEGVELLGLTETVDKESFGQLLRGFSPVTGKGLVQNVGDVRRRSAFDLTFTVPKSVSVVWGLAELELRKQIEAVVESSVRETLEVVQEYCGISRRGRHGERVEKAKLAAALFRHDTARAVTDEAPDPNLHIHCVLLNLVARPDGTTGALDARELFRPHMKMALGALFRAELSSRLAKLGLPSYRPIKNDKPVSWFELKNVPEELLLEFSKRRGQIEAWLDERGLSGAKAAEKAANATRQGKEPWRRDELFQVWRCAAERFGFQTLHKVLDADIKPKKLTELEQHDLALDAVVEITDHSAHFSEIECLRRVAEAAQTQGVRIEEIRSDVAKLLRAQDKIVELEELRGQVRYTTPEMLAIERRMLQGVMADKGMWSPKLRTHELLKRLSRFKTLRTEQKGAVEHLVCGIDRVACVNGMAGTGKTYMLGVANQLWQAEGRRVVGTALAAKAARGLEEGSGIPSQHIHSLLSQLEAKRLELNPETILVADEAGMIGTRMMDRLVERTRWSGSKLVLVGDYRQLQAIEAGGPFRAITQQVGAAELTEITRQKEAWARDAVRQFARGDAGHALCQYLERDLLRISDTRITAMRELVRDWSVDFRRGKQSLIFSGLRAETQLLNRFCQHDLLEAGLIDDSYVEIDKERIHRGDRVVFTRNNNRLLVRNGSGGRVAEVRPTESQIVVDLDTGYRIIVNLQAFPHVATGYAVTVHKGQGQTVDSAFVLAGGPMTDRELSYVQASRAREQTRIYCDADSAGEDLTQLARQMETSRAKDLAIEHTVAAR